MALNDYKSLPAAAVGVTLTTGTTAWAYTAYASLTLGLTTDIDLLGLTLMYDPLQTVGPVLDTTYETVVELSRGESQTLIAQIPFAWRVDSRVGHLVPESPMLFPEPLRVPGYHQISVRIANSAAFAIPYTGIKLFYQELAPVPAAFILAASANIPAGGTTATTAQLDPTAIGKTTANFGGGFISDDTNPLPAVDLPLEGYAEVEVCLQAVSGVVAAAEVYEFRVTRAGMPLTTYTEMPEWTIGTAAGLSMAAVVSSRRRRGA